MMRIPVTVAFLAILVPPVLADDIADRAKTCWSLLPSDYGLGGTVHMTVTTKDSLITGVVVSSYAPDDARGYAVAESAVKAVQRCAPYAVADGEHQVLMDVLGETDASSDVSIPKPGQQ